MRDVFRGCRRVITGHYQVITGFHRFGFFFNGIQAVRADFPADIEGFSGHGNTCSALFSAMNNHSEW
jgi:hypothetical protein